MPQLFRAIKAGALDFLTKPFRAGGDISVAPREKDNRRVISICKLLLQFHPR
jgi:FixJ family two-component response regulator